MKKELIALGAALALVGTLTACSSTPADQNKGSAGSGATGSTTGSAAGTAYPRSTRYGMNGTAGGHGYTYDGRYTAFPDGRVAPGRGNAARDMERVGKGVADGTRDLVNGVGDVVRDAGNGLRDVQFFRQAFYKPSQHKPCIQTVNNRMKYPLIRFVCC